MTITEKWEKKANEIMEKGFDLTKSEVKKVYAEAKRRNPGKLPEITGWFSSRKENDVWNRVECEICDGLTGDRLDDVTINCFLIDRRMSFVWKR